MLRILAVVCLAALLVDRGKAIRCYQCSSGNDPKGEDNCGAYNKFDKSRHIAIDCNTDESHTPGTFCMKIVQQSARGFIWDGRWRQVIRRCAAVAETGVTGVCNWGVYDNGVFWQECYCSEDGCNGASAISNSILHVFVLLSLLKIVSVLWFKCL